MTNKTEDDKAGKGEDTKAEKPVPSQNKADDIREAAAPEADAPPKKKIVGGGAPYPSQADLDAIKEGTFRRDVKAADAGAKYQTR